MSQSVFIPGPLPGMNDFVRKHHHVYSNMKREWGLIIKSRIRKAPMAASPEWKWNGFIKGEEDTMLSFFGEQCLKDAVVARVKEHQRLDQIIQGTYWAQIMSRRPHERAGRATGAGVYRGTV